MKRVLILTYYFPPYTGIEGLRPYSWYLDFEKYNLHPVVITRHWKKGDQKKWTDYMSEYGDDIEYTKDEHGEIFRLPYKKNIIFKKNIPVFIRKGLYWFFKIIGRLHIEIDAEQCFYKYSSKYIKDYPVDLILTSSPPLNLVRLAKRLSEENNTPFICDYRDLYSNKVLYFNQKFTLSEKIENKIFRYYIHRWNNRAKIITAASEPVLKLIANNKNESTVILNGYERELFRAVRMGTKYFSKFSIGILGQLYLFHDIDFMLRGFKEWVTENNIKDTKIIFIGLNAQPNVVDKVIQTLPSDILKITDRIDRNEALAIMRKCHILYNIGVYKAKGIFSGKIFEYLGLQRNILLAPSDKDVQENLLNDTHAGIAVDSVQEMKMALNEWYNEWKKYGKVAYYGDISKLDKYTREVQTQRLSEIINKAI